MTPKRWPSKPYRGARCDAHVGVTTDSTGAPRFVRCSNEATETVYVRPSPIEAYLCETCIEAMGEKVWRNPRVRRVPEE